MKLLIIELSSRMHKDLKAHCKKNKLSLREFIISKIETDVYPEELDNKFFKKGMKKQARS